MSWNPGSAYRPGRQRHLCDVAPSCRPDQGVCYNVGRAIGALFPAAVGFLAAGFGLRWAIAFGAAAYALCVVALLFLPETQGRVLVPVD